MRIPSVNLNIFGNARKRGFYESLLEEMIITANGKQQYRQIVLVKNQLEEIRKRISRIY